MAFIPADVMIDILLKVEAEKPLPFRCVSKFWKSIIVDSHFMETYISRSTTAIFDLLSNASNQYSAFKVKYIANNIVRRQENGPNDEEIHRVVNAFDEVQKLLNTVEKLCDEEKEKSEGDIRIAILNHMLVHVYIYERQLQL